ncbi:MAG: transcriptional regulator [candidate division Zixibacteria bacterium]|nr:transcriptional regulator [candidate division Zixibacteria bacterium]
MVKYTQLDPIIHAPIRLSAMTVLHSMKDADFGYLKEVTGATDGNLSTHLSRLESAEYIKIVKHFEAKKPKTTCSITAKGRVAYQKYISVLEQYIKRSK